MALVHDRPPDPEESRRGRSDRATAQAMLSDSAGRSLDRRVTARPVPRGPGARTTVGPQRLPAGHRRRHGAS
jgi:hypothetical protein